MLEAGQYEDNCFATLTYSDDTLPDGGSLDPVHPQRWLKRLRAEISPLRVRFYLVGEYGDATQRPHYHAALFGFPGCRFGVSQYTLRRTSCCPACDLVRKSWGLGNVLLGKLETASAGYLAGYVTKKMTRPDDPRLGGRHPEFARMSNRPGIGAGMMDDVASVLLGLGSSQADVPVSLRHGSRQLPLGRYLRRRLRRLIGRDEKCPPEVLEQLAEEMRPVLEAAQLVAPDGGAAVRKAVLSDLLVQVNEGRFAQIEARQRIYGKKRGSI